MEIKFSHQQRVLANSTINQINQDNLLKKCSKFFSGTKWYAMYKFNETKIIDDMLTLKKAEKLSKSSPASYWTAARHREKISAASFFPSNVRFSFFYQTTKSDTAEIYARRKHSGLNWGRFEVEEESESVRLISNKTPAII